MYDQDLDEEFTTLSDSSDDDIAQLLTSELEMQIDPYEGDGYHQFTESFSIRATKLA